MIKLIIGFIIGIISCFCLEQTISSKYSINLTYDCVDNNKYIFLPQIKVYDPKGKAHTDNPKHNKLRNYPHYLYSERLNITNLKIIFEFITKNLKHIRDEQCNDLKTLSIDGDMDHYSQYFNK